MHVQRVCAETTTMKVVPAQAGAGLELPVLQAI